MLATGKQVDDTLLHGAVGTFMSQATETVCHARLVSGLCNLKPLRKLFRWHDVMQLLQVKIGVQDVLQAHQAEDTGPPVSIAICSMDFIDINATRIGLQNTFDGITIMLSVK